MSASGQKMKMSGETGRHSHSAGELSINSMPFMLIGIDAQGLVNRWNRAAAETFGLEDSEVVGKPLWNCGIHWLSSEIQSTISDLLRAPRKFVWDGMQFKKNGESHLLGMTVTWVKTSNDEKGELLIVGSDITSRRRTEDELRAKTAFFEAQIQATIDGILVVDENGNILLHNERFLEIFEIPSELLKDPDDHPVLERAAQQVEDSGSFVKRVQYLYSHRQEKSRDEIRLRNGRVLDRYSSPVFGKDGHYYGRIWTFRDITDRKKDEDALRQLSVAVEQSPVSVVITDLQRKITYVNRRFTECTGYSYEEVIGQNLRLLNSGHTGPEEYHDLWQTIRRGEEWRGEFRNKRKNGELYWESLVISPIRTSAGEISHYLAVKEDITPRKQAEKDLLLTEFALENAADSVLWVDRNARILYANAAACRTLRRSRQELASLLITELDPLLPNERWQDFFEKLKAQGCLTFETHPRDKEGRVVSIEVMATYLEFDGQEYLLNFARDITERRMFEAQLQQGQKMESVGQLAAGIAHEINTPIQFVGDNLRFIKETWAGLDSLISVCESMQGKAIPSEALQQISSILQETDSSYLRSEMPRALDQSLDGISRVAKIVRAMKEFSHPGSEEKQAGDINQAILTTLTVSRNEWKYVADVETILQPDLRMVSCHISELNQVLLNLFINSAHAIAEVVGDGSQKKGKITIRTAQDAEFTTITVQDTGGGIRPEIQSRVFDPFFTTKALGRGTGQGLFLAHNSIVKKHGGKIWFESEVGKGTTFFIQLPTAGDAGAHV